VRLKILDNGSVGNCFLYEANSGQTLMIDFGINFDRIRKGLNFNYSNVIAVLNTHKHLDHFKAVKEVCNAGMDVYASKEVIEESVFKSHRLNEIEADKQYTFGEFKVIPFDVAHDCKCFGFLLYHPEMGKTVHITDTYFCKKSFTGLNNIVVEANYCTKILDEKQQLGLIQDWRANRLYKSHMSIDTTLGLLKANDLSQVYQVILIHLSESNSNAEEFQEKVYNQTQKKVTIAKKNLVIDFNKTPF